MKKILILGCGITGMTLARLFKNKRCLVDVREKEKFIGGMASDNKFHDFWVSKFGPRIIRFSPKTQGAKKFLETYSILQPTIHNVIALGNGNWTWWPPNKSCQQLFTALNPNTSMLSEFVDSYSTKVWGKDMIEVVGNISKRFAFKTTHNTDFKEGVPCYMFKWGCAGLFNNLKKDIKIEYEAEDNIDSLIVNKDLKNYDYIFVSAPIDKFFNYKFGKLEYVNIKFDLEVFMNDGKNLLLSPVMNLNTHPKIIRITEYNQFYFNKSKVRVIGIEKKDDKGTMCYPVMTAKNKELYNRYSRLACEYKNLYFVGRLGEYKYKDFDVACQDAINLFNRIIVRKT